MGDFTEDFSRYEDGGLYLEGLIFGILRYFPENLICKLRYNESENFSGSSLHHIFEFKNCVLFCKKNKPNRDSTMGKLNFRKS